MGEKLLCIIDLLSHSSVRGGISRRLRSTYTLFDDDDDLRDFDVLEDIEPLRPNDRREAVVAELLRNRFNTHKDQVFFSRQLEIQHEDDFYHWITNRALHRLIGEGLVLQETRKLKAGGEIKLVWRKGYRFYKRNAKRIVAVVNEYSDPNILGVVGLHGEMMVLEGFARMQFVMRGRNTREFNGLQWNKSNHNLDFIFERDGRVYGVEVKNTLAYMDENELELKTEMCQFLGITPVFAARMLPKSWIDRLVNAGGYAMIMKYQLYPWTHKELAKRVARELHLPIDAPKALLEGTLKRFLNWHSKKL